MKAEIIRIGNSHGVRIPKPVLEQCGLSGQVEMNVENNQLIIAASQSVRKGWNEAFQTMADSDHDGDDEILMDDTGSAAFDQNEWQW